MMNQKKRNEPPTVQYGPQGHRLIWYALIQCQDLTHNPLEFVRWTEHSTAEQSRAEQSRAEHSTAQHSTAQHSTAQHSTEEQKASDMIVARTAQPLDEHPQRRQQNPRQVRGDVPKRFQRRDVLTPHLRETVILLGSFPPCACPEPVLVN